MPSMSFVSFTSKPTTVVEPTPDHVESLSTHSAPPVTAAEDSDKSTLVATPSDDTSEPQSLSQVFYPSLAAFKDQRAYEHERQRSKKAADLAKAKARKGQWSLLTYDSKKALTLSRSSSTRSRTPEKSRRLSSEEVTTVDALSVEGTGNHTGLTHVSLVGVGGDVAVHGNDKSEVKLADLISSGSVRKPRARKVKDSDYEVVPHVRSVIVLDDITTRDVTFDEPWEHIDHSDSDDSSSDTGVLKKNVKKTYASILSVNGNDNTSSN